jgi:hypothetical protein
MPGSTWGAHDRAWRLAAGVPRVRAARILPTLKLERETVRTLQNHELRNVEGGLVRAETAASRSGAT